MKIIPAQVFKIIDEIAYFYITDDNFAALIDPGAEADKLKRIAEENELKLTAILLTHGHFDHIGAAEELAKFYNIPIYAGQGGAETAKNPRKNLSLLADKPFCLEGVVEKNEGDIIEIGANCKLKVIATPGHTEDGTTYFDEIHGVAFVGDTIFEGSYGRTDFPGGDEEILFKSIKEKIFNLPDNTKLYSGHSDVTTVEVEKTRTYYM